MEPPESTAVRARPHFDLALLSSRICDTDLLVQSLQLQNLEVADLKAQLAALGASLAGARSAAVASAERIDRLLGEQSVQRAETERLRAELQTERERTESARQASSAGEQRLASAEDELLDVCRQFLRQGNVLAAHHLADGPANRQYMRVVDVLRRRGQNVDALLLAGQQTRGSRPTRGCTIAVQTDPPAAPPRSVTRATMTDAVRFAPEPPRTCDRATQALPTTTTRATSTADRRKTPTTVSVGTSFPEPVPLDVIFRERIRTMPTPWSPIGDLSADAVQHTGCQTDADDDSAEREKHTARTASVGTMTTLANIRKRVDYARKTAGQRAFAPAASLLNIKKEDPLADLHASMLDAAAVAAGMGAGMGMFDQLFVPAARSINPHLQGLWRVIGQMLFTIIGTGNVFQPAADVAAPDASNMETIQRTLAELRKVMEMSACAQTVRQSGTPSESVRVRSLSEMSDETVEAGGCESPLSRSDPCAKPSTTVTAITPNGGRPSADDDRPAVATVTLPPVDAAETDVPKIRLVSVATPAFVDCASTGCQATSTDDAPACPRTPPACDASAPIAADGGSSSASPASSSSSDASNSSPELAPLNDDAIFKRPTSSVRRMSAHQKARVRKNLTQMRKMRLQQQPIVVQPPVYSIDRNFKRTRRKPTPLPPNCAPLDVELLRRKRKRSREAASAAVGGSGADRKRARMASDLLECRTIVRLFNVPQLIEPIAELEDEDSSSSDSDSDSSSSDSESSSDEDEQQVPDRWPAVPEQPMRIDASSTLFQDLFGDGSSSSSSEDEADMDSDWPQTEADALQIGAETAVHSEPAAVDALTSGPPHDPDWSPASPPDSSLDSDDEFDSDADHAPAKPIRIPTETQLNDPQTSTVRALLAKCQAQSAPAPTVAPAPDHKDVRLYARLHRYVQRFVGDATFDGDTVDECARSLLARPTVTRQSLAACLQETVEDIADDEPLELGDTPPAPALTATHQRIVVLVDRIDRRLPGFRRLCVFRAERSLFRLTAKATANSATINVNLLRYQLALDDVRRSGQHKSRVRLLLFKCLYYFQAAAVPLLLIVLQAHPQCLPPYEPLAEPTGDGTWNATAFGRLDPLVQALHTALSAACHPLAMAVGGNYKAPADESALQPLLQRLYGRTPNVRPSYEQLVANVLQRIRDGRLHNVTNALVLVAKRCGTNWTMRVLLNGDAGPLAQLLRAYLPDSASNEARIVCLLRTLGSLAKPLPAHENIDWLQELLAGALRTSPSVAVQDAAVRALLQTARFGYANVFRHIADWRRPAGAGDRKLWLQLRTFVQRKPMPFWSALVRENAGAATS